ncbi:MAG: hypothetical protein IJD75_00535, partial [Clostridia bacterium]|nr:hypothetical protein [Clostridia bacterium]
MPASDWLVKICATFDGKLEDFNMRIDEIYISARFCELVTAQSCDCKEILLKSGGLFYLISHRLRDEGGYIEIKRTDGFHSEDFTYTVDFGGQSFYFDKALTLENGCIDGIRFRSEQMFLFIFALEHNLVLTQTAYDLFGEAAADIPFEGDEPMLS